MRGSLDAETGREAADDERNGGLDQHARAEPAHGGAAAPEQLGERAGDRDRQDRAERGRADPQGSARTEDQRLHCGDRDAERVGDLRVGTPFELAHHERRSLVEGEPAERPEDALDVGLLLFGNCQLVDVLLQRHFLHAAADARIARACDVVRDLDQPVLRLEDLLPALKRAVRVEERRLRDVLRVGRVAQQRQGVVIDVLDVPSVELFERLVPG